MQEQLSPVHTQVKVDGTSKIQINSADTVFRALSDGQQWSDWVLIHQTTIDTMFYTLFRVALDQQICMRSLLLLNTVNPVRLLQAYSNPVLYMLHQKRSTSTPEFTSVGYKKLRIF